MGRASANEAVGLVSTRDRRVTVRVLCVRDRIEDALDTVRRSECAILVNGLGRLLRQVRHARRITRLNGTRSFNTFNGWVNRFVRIGLAFVIS